MARVRSFQVNWRMKAAVFRVLDRIPKGDAIHFLMQRHLTGTYPRQLSPTSKIAVSPLRHVGVLTSAGIDISTARAFEFGAGWDLYNNLVYYCMGLNHQSLVDIRELAHADAINFVIDHLQKDPPSGATRLPGQHIRQSHLKQDLKELYGISYVAPADARATGLADASIDFISTTSVFEHVPSDALRDIVKECHRILKPSGIMSHIIDYSDHYAHSDGGISNFNYLRFSNEEWRQYNPSIHYQNRLRRPDYEALFEAAGFSIESLSSWSESDDVEIDFRVDQKFEKYSVSEIRELGCHVVLRCRA